MSKLHPYYDICGIDISRWQIWDDPAKSIEMGVDFVIIRAGNGTLRDSRYTEQRAKAEKHGIPMAFYWYWQPGLSAKDQAREMRSTLHGGDNVFIDMEHNDGDNWPGIPTMQRITQLALEMLDECDRVMGDEVGIYTSPGWWAGWISRSAVPKFRLSVRALWVAAWSYSFTRKPQRMPHGWTHFDVWQFSGSLGPWRGKARDFGITFSTSVDVNAFDGTSDQAKKLFRLPMRAGA